MLKLFKRSYALYWVLTMLGIIPIAALIWNNYPIGLLYIIAIPVWMIIAGMIANIYGVKLTQNMNATLNDECNTKDFIAFYEKALEKENINYLRSYILLNLSAGYLSSGDFAAGKQILDMVSRIPDTKDGASHTVCFFNNLAVYYIRTNELDYAENTLKNLNEALKNPKLDTKYYVRYERLYSFGNVVINVARGNYNGAEDYLNMLFDKDKTLLMKVSAKYYLGDLYVRLGDPEKAASAFEYVLQNGNDTYYAQRASEYLGKPLITALPPVKP